MEKHFTATAFIVDSNNRTLLMWHKRLQRWMPPGGHVDENEAPEETAKRECKEETGLDVDIIGDDQPNLFSDNPEEGSMLIKPIAMLLENISASAERNEPAHLHMDFLFKAKPIDESQELIKLENEMTELKWFTKEEIIMLDASREIFSNVKTYILMMLR